MGTRRTWLLASDKDLQQGLMKGCTVYEFEPMPDITAYELALTIKAFGEAGLSAKVATFHDFEMPDPIGRHFRCVQRL